jgi:excisionase family DNA binding protein
MCLTLMPEWMTLDEAAAYLKVSKPTLYRWVQERRIVAYELPSGRGRRFSRDELDNLLSPVGEAGYAIVDGKREQALLLRRHLEAGSVEVSVIPNVGLDPRIGTMPTLQRRIIPEADFEPVPVPFPDKPAGSSKYVGEVGIIPPNEAISQPVVGVLYQLGVPVHAHREVPEPGNHYSVRFPLSVYALNREDARARLAQTVKSALVEVLDGHELRPEAIRIEVYPDTLHGPSRG